MNDKLVVAVLGNRNSGKSHTWNRLFGRIVKTGNKIRRLPVSKNRDVDVFLVSGSSEERHRYVGEIVGECKPRIVLCSMQYRGDVTETIDYFVDNGYSIFVHWLNPGYSDLNVQEDKLGLIQYLLDQSATRSNQGRKNTKR